MTNNDAATETTVAIEASYNTGNGTGTGFMFAFMNATGDEAHPVLFTNKHVVEGAESIKLRFSTSAVDKAGVRNGVCTFFLDAGWRELWLPHPAQDVDLGCISLGPLLHRLVSHGIHGHGHMFSEKDLLDSAATAELSSVEDILMVGYPSGLYDTKHNRPLVRRGITASDIKLDFEGLQEFVIDCAAYPGSSGSPIVLPQKVVSSPAGVLLGLRRNALVGVLHAGPTRAIKGTVIVEPGVTPQETLHRDMMNLGYVIKAHRLREFRPLLASLPTTLTVQVRSEFKAAA